MWQTVITTLRETPSQPHPRFQENASLGQPASAKLSIIFGTISFLRLNVGMPAAYCNLYRYLFLSTRVRDKKAAQRIAHFDNY